MKKSTIREFISLKNNPKKTEKIPNNSDIQILQNNNLYNNSLYFKFKTQKGSPKKNPHLTIKNDSLNKDKFNHKQLKIINSIKEKIKVISKNESILANKKNQLYLLNNLSYENRYGIYFRNNLIQNNRYNPKSFENIISININKKQNESIMLKYKNNKIINIKRKNQKTETNNLNKTIKKKIKIIRTHDIHDIYYRNSNNIKNSTLKDYIINHSCSNKSHNLCITRMNSKKNSDSFNISSHNLNAKKNKEEYILFSQKNINQNKLNFINNHCYKKINILTTPITENSSRYFSAKKKMSNNESIKNNKRAFIKDEKKSLILTCNNSKILKKNLSKKQNSIVNNKSIKYIQNKNNKDNIKKLNNEIKVLKPNKKKKIIIINKKNNKKKSNNNRNINSNIKNSFKNNELFSTENKEYIMHKINKIQNEIIHKNHNVTNNDNNLKIIKKKKISISNTKSKNSVNNSIQNNQIIKNKTMNNNNKNIIKSIEKQKIQNRGLLVKRLIQFKNNFKLNYIKSNALINKIKKKAPGQKIINIFPTIKKSLKNKQYSLTNSRILIPFINNNSSIFDNIKKNKTKIEENNIINNNKIYTEKDIESNKEKQKIIKNISVNNDIYQDEKKNNNENNENNDKNININNYFSEESQKLIKYIKNYYNLNNDYPSSDISFYKFGRVIGKGAFGKVNIGLHVLTGRIVAIKSFNKTKFPDEKYKKKIMNEINLMKNLKHFSVVKLLDTIETDKYILLIMENILGGDLLSFIKKRNKLPEKIAKFIFKQLLQSIKYIHNKNIVHRDIKLDNILIDLNNNIKLCDFGVGKNITDNNELLYEQCGTPAYIAPEVLAGEGYCGFPVDIWSSGVVLYSLLMGNIPFKSQNLNELQGLIMSGNYKRIEGISKNGKDLLDKLLEINPNKRISADEALNHPWFLENNDIDDNKSLNLFTKAELILLSKNNTDYRNCKKEDIIENFTIENLDTNKFNENKNNKTKSFIFAPFNTSYDINELNYYNIDIKDNILEKGLAIQNNIILFEQDANNLNRQYELNNNGEIDHGVIIKNSFDKDNKIVNDNDDLKEKDIISNEYNKSNNNYNSDIYKKISEKENEKYIKINKQKIPNDSNRNKYNNMNSTITYSSTMMLDENIIKNMENLGYKKEYVQKCIINNELNYCHATYYLLLNSSDL